MNLAVTRTSATSPQLDHTAYARDATAQRAPALAPLNSTFEDLACNVRARSDSGTAGGRLRHRFDWGQHSHAKELSGAALLLDELAVERGLRWSDIARLCSVPEATVRTWRSSTSPAPEHCRSLAYLAALLDLLEVAEPMADPAGWLFTRLADGSTVTAADLYLAGHIDDLLEHAHGRLAAPDMLDRWDARWRDTTRSDWRIVANADGDRVLTRRD